jgi:hypothetical protein
MTTEQVSPTVEFFSLYPDVREPELGSPDLRGSLSARAARVCAPVTTASAFCWHIYPPADFAVRWDGVGSEWSLLEDNEPVAWRSLSGGHDGMLPCASAVLAGADGAGLDIFEKYGGGVPFVQADPRKPHMLEVITGLLARTSPDWWLLVRDVPNWPRSGDHQLLEGIIETTGTAPTYRRWSASPSRTASSGSTATCPSWPSSSCPGRPSRPRGDRR